MFLNVVFTLIKLLIEFGLNPALTVVCLLIYILFVCLFTYFISIISLSLKLEQITPPRWQCHEHFRVSNILYWIVEDVFKCHFHIKNIFNRVWIEFSISCCLFVYIHIFVCWCTYFISIISRRQYDSADTSNSNIRPLMIILWQNIFFLCLREI